MYVVTVMCAPRKCMYVVTMMSVVTVPGKCMYLPTVTPGGGRGRATGRPRG